MSTWAMGVAEEEEEEGEEVEDSEPGAAWDGFLARNVASFGIVAAARI
jgi:hypothetical protein